MGDKIAFVFDTNFIIQNHDLETVTQKLMEHDFVAYVTQVAIDERIAQECNKQKEKYDELEKIKDKFCDFASIKITKKYEDTQRYYKEGMRKKYDSLFGKNIVPLSTDEDTFSKILERAYAKIPPFIKGSSDKGFKDTLMWMSLIDYFSKDGESKVVFVTDDNGFRDNINALEEEFNNITGKTIEIKSNSYYKEIIAPIPVMPEPKQLTEIQYTVNLTALRDEIQEAIHNICWTETEDYWGNTEWNKTFTTSKPFDASYVAQIFEQLGNKIELHILEQSVFASSILDMDNRIKDGDVKIPMASLERAFNLYLEIKEHCADYVQSFYTASIGIMNKNCEYKFDFSDDEELPF